MFKFIRREKYDDALSKGEFLIPNFLNNIYNGIRRIENSSSEGEDNLNKRITFLSNIKSFPLIKKEISDYLEEIKLINQEEHNSEYRAKSLYQTAYDFFNKMCEECE